MIAFENIKPIYDLIFKDLNGYSVSLQEKKQKETQKYIRDLIYGEIPFELLYALFVFEPIKDVMNSNGVFYDIGSGIGNTVIGSYLIGNFKRCIGIEILDSLYKISEIVKKRTIDIYPKNTCEIQFKHGNMLNFNFSDGDVLLFCCPNKDDNIRMEMENKFLDLKNGAIIISLIHSFNNKNDFHLITSRMVRSTWGETPMYIYKRV